MANPQKLLKDTWWRGAIRGAVAMGSGALANELLPLPVLSRVIAVGVVAAIAYLLMIAIFPQTPAN